MKRGYWAIPAAVPLIALLAFGFRPKPSAAGSPLLNKPAPPFTLHTLNGRTVSLASLRGHPVVLNFWASWCVPCKQEHPYLLQAWHRYAPRGVDFVGITFNDSAADARAFLQTRGGAWTIAQDPGLATAVDYGVSGVPETFVLDRRGIVRLKSTGPIVPSASVTPSGLDRELDQLLGTAA